MKMRSNSFRSAENSPRPKKRLGQNFLKDPGIADSIVSLSGVNKDDHVIEIGAGTGFLTFRLSEVCGRLTAIETDASLIPGLLEKASSFTNVEIINQDIMKTDLGAISGGSPLKVVANLPYYITTPVIMKLLEEEPTVTDITVMVQKEAAERLTAAPGSPLCGAVSYGVSWYCTAEDLLDVPPTSFYPQPKVQSRVIRLKRRSAPPVTVADSGSMFRIIKAAFSQRRKTLINAVSSLTEYDRETVREAVKATGLNENVRGEALTLKEFAALSDKLSGKSPDIKP